MRADKFLSSKFGSRSKAKSALLSGLVLKDGRPLPPDGEVDEGDELIFLPADPFVSHGGDKLERGLDFFFESVEGSVCADLGASTGGFTDCLLRRGARRVYCVDVGENQLDGCLRSDPRVTVMDRTNARYLTAESFTEPVDTVVADLSFISLRLILPAVNAVLPAGGRAFVLFKPQFECGGRGLGKRGILPVSRHRPLLFEFYPFCRSLGLSVRGIVPAPIRERKNIEYVLFLHKGGEGLSLDEFMQKLSEIFDNIYKNP